MIAFFVSGWWRRCGGRVGGWGMAWVSCGGQGWRVGAFSVEGNRLGLVERWERVSRVYKIRIGSERTLYARPVCPPCAYLLPLVVLLGFSTSGACVLSRFVAFCRHRRPRHPATVILRWGIFCRLVRGVGNVVDGWCGEWMVVVMLRSRRKWR